MEDVPEMMFKVEVTVTHTAYVEAESQEQAIDDAVELLSDPKVECDVDDIYASTWDPESGEEYWTGGPEGDWKVWGED